MQVARRGTDIFAEVARSLAEQVGLQATLQRVVDLAVETVPGAAHAGVSAVQARRRVETVAATADIVCSVDDVQYEVGEGPCLEAIFEQDVVEIGDLRQTERWPEFSKRAADLGVMSMLSFRLFVEGDTAGALNLYATEPRAFTTDSADLGHVFAAHAALAWDHEKEVDGLRAAVETRTLIGQAQGILMAQRRITSSDAFGLLRRSSQHHNVKLRAVAEHVVRTGTLPAGGGASAGRSDPASAASGGPVAAAEPPDLA